MIPIDDPNAVESDPNAVTDDDHHENSGDPIDIYVKQSVSLDPSTT